MAVYERTYRPYRGELTPSRSRFLVVPRYSFRETFRSRLFVAFFALCFAVPFAGVILVYLHYNLSALKVINLPLDRLQEALPIDAAFFHRGLQFQGFLAFILVLVVGPSLIAPDLRNNGLALYLSRPFSRREYVTGKMTVLLTLLSLITWVPGLLVFALAAYLDKAGWMVEHLRIAASIFVGSWAWILALSLLTLAVSAWVKWKPVARIALLVLYFVVSGFGRAIDHVLDTWWGELVSLPRLIETVQRALFGLSAETAMPAAAAWGALTLLCLGCLGLLALRVRAYEVVR